MKRQAASTHPPACPAAEPTRDVDLPPPRITARVAVEMGAVLGSDRYAGPTGAIVGMHGFGASGRIADVLAKFGFVPDKIMQAAKNQIAKNKISKTKDHEE